ncbi:inositol monophosphatase family protein [Actinomycetes bacterium KLBMP 9797]
MAAHRLLRLALHAARLGGAEIARRTGGPVEVTYKASTDPVTSADRAGEAAIVGLIRRERPADGILAEEGTWRASTSGLRWVVDALDGTVNFLYGVAHTAVSVACEARTRDGWTAVVGVVHDPARNETYTAVRGQGSRLDRTPIAVNDPVVLSAALIATEFSYDARMRARQGSTMCRVLPRIRDIRSTGSSALDLCWTAAGRFDGYFESELSRWDWSAGALIVTEAGGKVTPLGTGVLAAGQALHPRLRVLLRPDRG